MLARQGSRCVEVDVGPRVPHLEDPMPLTTQPLPMTNAALRTIDLAGEDT